MAVIGFVGCSKDNDEGGGNAAIVGRWEVVTTHDWDYNPMTDKVEWVLADTYAPNSEVWEFTSDGKVIIYDDGMKTWTLSYSYDASKKELTFMGIVCEVEKLTSRELVLIQQSIDNDPVTYKTTFRRK